MPFSDSMYDPTDSGYDYPYPDYSQGSGIPFVGGIQVNLPSGISIGAGPMNNLPSVPVYPATSPALYQRPPMMSSGISSNMLLLIVAVVVAYVFLK